MINNSESFKNGNPVLFSTIGGLLNGGKYSADLFEIYVGEDNDSIYSVYFGSEEDDIDHLENIILIIVDNIDKKIRMRCSRALQGDRLTEDLIIFPDRNFVLNDHMK